MQKIVTPGGARLHHFGTPRSVEAVTLLHRGGLIAHHSCLRDELDEEIIPVIERSRQVMKAVDQINARHGRDSVRYGALQPNGRPKTKSLRRSASYTTCLKEVLRVA